MEQEKLAQPTINKPLIGLTLGGLVSFLFGSYFAATADSSNLLTAELVFLAGIVLSVIGIVSVFLRMELCDQ